jgi:hypothetical protein
MLGVMALMAVVGGLAYPVFGMMPAFAGEVLQVDALGLGILMAAGAFGSVLGTLTLSRLGGQARGRRLALAGLLLPGLVVLFAATRQLWSSITVLIAIGILLLVVQSLAITLVQLHIADRVRGRVMSIYSLLHAGSDTLGNVAVGAAAMMLGLPVALAAGGLLALGFAIALWVWLPGLRHLD